HWMKENFGGTMNDALRTVLSVKKSVKPVEKKQISLAIDRETAEELLKQYAKKHNVAKARLIKELLNYQPIPKELVTGKLNVSAATLKTLEEQKIITTTVEEVYRSTTGVAKVSLFSGISVAFLSFLRHKSLKRSKLRR
ncbi:MAG: hypothetical protein II358_04145, partial [Tidjanibacter sp.]|nr:hypothetical protein [Tidjanibacter sp.]